jgi:predicted RND superfamily exporter protein
MRQGRRSRMAAVLVTLGVVMLVGYVAAGLSRITLDVDVTRLLPPGLKETAGYRLLLKHFAGSEELIVALEGGEPGEVEAVAAALERSLTTGPAALARRVIWRSPFEMGTEMPGGETASEGRSPSPALTEFLAWSLLNQPPETLLQLEQQLAPDRIDTTLTAAVESLTTSLGGLDHLMGYDPLGLTSSLLAGDGESRAWSPSLASADGRFRLLYVESAQPLPDYRAMGQWLAAVRALAEPVAAPRGVTVRFTGEPAFVSEISSSMERDMKVSGILALALICLVVWLGYRDLWLLPVLIVCVGVIFLLTLATAGLLAGRLTVLTVGCGSILIGLTVDYGVLLYAAGGGPGGDDALRRTRRGILWAAATTAASFAALIFGGMPGLAELGLLVTVGVVLGAAVFLGVYPRVLALLRLRPRPMVAGLAAGEKRAISRWADRVAPLAIGVVVVVGWAGWMTRGLPQVDLDSGSLRPRVSEAYDTLDRMTDHLGQGESTLSVLVSGHDETEVAERLDALEVRLRALQQDQVITSFSLPHPLWPSPARQYANLSGPAARLAGEEGRLRLAVEAAGFSDEAFGLAAGVFGHWRSWADRLGMAAPTQALWPEDAAARWLLARFAVTASGDKDPAAQSLCLGLIRPRIDPPDAATLEALRSLQTNGVYLAGSKLIGRVMEDYLSRGFFWLAVTFGVVTLALLAVALRRVGPFLVVLVSLVLAFGALIGGMSWLGLGWNSFTLPALLLSLGTGSDYFIYVALELQDHGSAARMRARLARPLLVCVGASVCGFGSLAWAGNLGLSSLGRVCALALALNLLVALCLMPWIWRAAARLRKRFQIPAAPTGGQ